MRPTSWLLAGLVFSFVIHASELPEKAANLSSRDVKVPGVLVTRIEKDYREFLKANQLPDNAPIKRRLMNVALELRQKRPGALHEDVRVNTPLGGGVVDLVEFVTPLRGGFHVKIVPTHENHSEVSSLRVFFVSRAKSRQLDGEIYGAGCDKFMEITSLFREKMTGPGFEVYTADQRYVSVLGGVYILVAFENDALEVGSISIMDSRYPGLMCE